MKLEAKLGLSTGILVSAMFLSAINAHSRVETARSISVTVTNQQVPIVKSTQVLGEQLSLTVRALESAMLFGSDPATARHFTLERTQRMAQAEEAAVSAHLLLKKTGSSPLDLTRFERVEANMERLRTLEEQASELNSRHSKAGVAQAFDLTRREILPLDAALEGEIRIVADSQGAFTDTLMKGLDQAYHSILFSLWVGALTSALVGGWLSLLLTRRIANSIRNVAQRADAIAAGDLTGRNLSITSKDEIGDLAIAMQKMQDHLVNAIGTAIQTARSLTGSADSMHTAGDLIHRRIDAQSQQTQQAATALQEMSASIAEVSRHARSAADTARSAAQTAHEGGHVVRDMLGSMSRIAAAFEDTSATVGLLGDDSKRISQIVTVIDDIARKTNLLALNAAIEAARAGEQGRGFAVVAGEVRRLAESTAQATSQIAAMIRGIQDRTHTAVASLATGTITVEQGVATTHLAGESLERIIGMAERVDRMIAQIAIAATQQSVAANDSSASLHSIYSLSHENLCEMATTRAGIETLRTTAIALEQHVVRFRLEQLEPISKDQHSRVSQMQVLQPA